MVPGSVLIMALLLPGFRNSGVTTAVDGRRLPQGLAGQAWGSTQKDLHPVPWYTLDGCGRFVSPAGSGLNRKKPQDNS